MINYDYQLRNSTFMIARDPAITQLSISDYLQFTSIRLYTPLHTVILINDS